MGKVQAIFEEQLQKCGVAYFDFYLFHNVCEMNIDAYLDAQYGISDYLLLQLKAGRIRHLGFSAHGSCDVMKRFLKAYGRYMEFCQLQVNYIDWSFQYAKAKVDLLNEYHIPIWVMEPMRGGQLAALSDENAMKLKQLRLDEKIPAWAFRFIQSIPNVVVSLTGASNFEQLQDNIETYKSEKPLTQQEMETLLNIAESMINKVTVPCTACKYCVRHCPQGLDIPMLLKLYNEHCFTGGGFIAPMALAALPEDKHPKACVTCKNCEAVCPQHINISQALADFTAKLK
jgi:predicted aldo/keto reductase-like oxidoreductase